MARESELPMDSDPNENQISNETLKEIDFFKINNNDHNKVVYGSAFAIDNDHMHTKTPSFLELKLNTGTGLNLLTPNTSSDQSMVNDDGMSPSSDDKRIKNQMAILQGRLDRANTENRRLKLMLGQLQSDYDILRMNFNKVMHDRMVDEKSKEKERIEKGGVLVPSEVIDLELVPNVESVMDLDPSSSSMGRKRSRDELGSPTSNTNVASNELVLYKKSIVSDETNELGKRIEREDGSIGNAEKTQSLSLPNNFRMNQAEDALAKARVSVRARSTLDMIPDGGQWRKYGQKMAKGNPPCARSYYRCSLSSGCPVRKQIQRCNQDTTIVCTTYEGYHNHPLPEKAKEMAQRTSSAAKMILTGSTSSNDGKMNANTVIRKPLPGSSSSATISVSSTLPIVTLDYTQASNNRLTRCQNLLQIPVNNPQNYASYSASQIPQRFINKVPPNVSIFSGLDTSATNAANPSKMLPSLPNIDQTVAASMADPKYTAALASAICFFMRSSQSTSNDTTSSVADETGKNNNGSDNNNGKQ